MTTRDKIWEYLHRPASHVQSRQAVRLMYEAIVALDNAAADERRMDWLADPENATGKVVLPIVCVEAHPESMRAAIDMAMGLSSNVEIQGRAAAGGESPGM